MNIKQLQYQQTYSKETSREDKTNKINLNRIKTIE